MEIRTGLARQIIENLSLPVCCVDRKAVIHFANPAFRKLLPASFDLQAGLVLTDFFSHMSGKTWEESYQQILDGLLEEDRGVLELAGDELSVHVLFSPLAGNSQDLVSVTLTRVHRELTALPEGLPLLRSIDDAAVCAFLNDRYGNILYANRSACRQLGYSLDELKSMKLVDIDAEHSVFQLRDLVRGKQAHGEQAVFETLHRRKDGSTYVAEISVNTDQSKYQDYIFSFFRDVTELRKQRALKDQLSFLVENASDAVYIFDEERRIVYVNEQAARLSGYSREELLGMDMGQLDANYPADTLEAFLDMAARGERIVFESEHRNKAGALFPVEVSLAVSIFDGKIHNSAFVRDISDRKEYLREMEELRFALENSSDAIYLYDRSGRIHYANWTACRELGYGKEELGQMTVGDLDPTFDEKLHQGLWDDAASMNLPPLETRHWKKDGGSYPVEVVVSATTLDGREYAVAFARDISERLEVQKALKEGEERFRLIADTSPIALIISRVADGRIRYANRQAASLVGLPLEELYAVTLGFLLQQRGVEQEVLELLEKGKSLVNREILLKRGEEPLAWVSLNTSTMELQGELVMGSLLLDVTEAKELSNQLSYHATYDDLTGLVNRREFEDRLQEVIEISERRQTENALCYLDLDQFKIINDTCGHMAGDELLRQLAQVLYQSVRRDDTLARLGGDEFAILLEMCTLEDAEAVAHKVRQAVQEFRFLWQGKTFNISVSIGLVPIATEGESISDVLRRADTACYAAKDAGRNRIHVFRFDDQELAQRHGEMQWVARITSALDSGRLELWKQRILPLADGEHGDYFELLVRLRDESGNLILPGAFLPAAERYDLASRIDRWVINETFDWLARNPDQVEQLAHCAINLSGRTLSDTDFLDEVTTRLKRSRVPPGKICFEITETAAIANLSLATAFMRTLKSLGCAFSLDDFGSGLSSFAYLKNLPVDFVKIDGFFVKDVTTDPIDLAMVKAINDMAHAMGKKTIAEFVEDAEILRVLMGLGVDYVQGYGIAKPVPLRKK